MSTTLERRRAEGKCRLCENPRQSDTRFCGYHLVHQADLAEKRRKAKVTEGLCLDCDQPPVKGLVRCQACLDHDQSRFRSRKTRLRSQGLCWSCAQRPFTAEHDRCIECIDASRVSNLRYRKSNKISAFEAYGGVRCNCCDERELTMLALNHILNNGADARGLESHLAQNFIST